MKVKPNLIFRPTDQFGKLCPDPKAEYLLLDRVVNIDKGITVPLGLRGTVVGIYKGNGPTFVYMFLFTGV